MKVWMALALACLVGVCAPVSAAWKQERFIVTFWCPPPATDAALSAAAAEGFNLTWLPADKLDMAAKYKMKALVQDDLLSPASLDDAGKREKLAALIDGVKGHPALEGYYITDEPGAGAFAGLGRLVAFIKERDPGHLAYINLLPTYASEAQLGVSADEAEKQKVGIPLNFEGTGDYKKTILAYREHLREFVDVVKPELISYDHYHFLKNGVDGGQYFLNLGLIREASLSSGLPFLNIIQASTIEPAWRLVNRKELRWLVYTTAAYGGRGISYFLYWGPLHYGGLYQDGARTPLALDAAELNSELAVLGPELMKLSSTAVYHTGPVPVGGVALPSDSPVQFDGPGQFVLGLFSEKAFMVVNRDYKKPAVASLVLPEGVRALREFDRASGKWVTYTFVDSSRKARVALKAGDGRLMKMVFAGDAID